MDKEDAMEQAKDAADRADEANIKAGRTPASQRAAFDANQALTFIAAATDEMSWAVGVISAEKALERAEDEANRVRRESYPEPDRGFQPPVVESAADIKLREQQEKREAQDRYWDKRAGEIANQQREIEKATPTPGSVAMSNDIEAVLSTCDEVKELAEKGWNIASNAKEKLGEAQDLIQGMTGTSMPEKLAEAHVKLAEAREKLQEGQALATESQQLIDEYKSQIMS